MTDSKVARAWNSSLPARTEPIKRGEGLKPGKALKQGGQLQATPKRKPAPKVVPCTMCREPAESRSRYCEPCKVIRQLVLMRDGFACICCGVSIIGQHYSLGHRLRASQGGRAVPSNLLTLLGLGGEAHHGRIDLYRDPEDEAKGYRLRSGDDPKQVSVMVFSPGGSGFSAYPWDDGTWRDYPEQVAA